MKLRAPFTATALLGTAQHPFDAPPAGTPLDGLLARVPGTEPAQRFLESAALLVAYERAGVMPTQAPSAPPPAEDDPRPRCSPIAAGHLTELLAERRSLLPEWLSLLADSGQRPPEELMPALLNAATGDRALREGVTRAGGPLAIWLAPFRGEWNWLIAPAADESIWESGSTEERLAFLSQLRLTDPARSLTLLQASWPSEPADNKRRFLETFATGRSMGDEPFLESLLDDRSIVVRRAAAEHLGSIAGSRLVERMKARVAGRIRTVRTGLLRKSALELEPFDSVDAAMIRDGIEQKAPATVGLGARAWWTLQAIGAISPDHWCEEFRLEASGLMAAAKNGQWNEALLEGWRTAAIRYAAPDWLEALTGGELEPGQSTTALFLAMPAAARERATLRLLRVDPKKWLPAAPVLCPHAWSVSFTEEFVRAVERNLPKEPADLFQYQLRPLLRAASACASPLARWQEADDAFAEFTDTLSFRRRMREAILSRRT